MGNSLHVAKRGLPGYDNGGEGARWNTVMLLTRRRISSNADIGYDNMCCGE